MPFYRLHSRVLPRFVELCPPLILSSDNQGWVSPDCVEGNQVYALSFSATATYTATPFCERYWGCGLVIMRGIDELNIFTSFANPQAKFPNRLMWPWLSTQLKQFSIAQAWANNVYQLGTENQSINSHRQVHSFQGTVPAGPRCSSLPPSKHASSYDA